MSRIFKHVNLFHRGTVGDGVVTAFSCRGYLYTSLRQERRGALHEPTSVDVASRSCEVRSLSQIVYGGHLRHCGVAWLPTGVTVGPVVG